MAEEVEAEGAAQMLLYLGASTGLWFPFVELSKPTQLGTLLPHANFPSPSMAHTLLRGCR